MFGFSFQKVDNIKNFYTTWKYWCFGF